MTKLLTLLPIACLITSCMVGPNFHSPTEPQLAQYDNKPLPNKTVASHSLKQAGAAQHFVATNNFDYDWWELFHSSAINQLINIGMHNSPTLASSYATLRQAEETRNAEIGSTLFPTINATAGATRGQNTDAGSTFGTGKVLNLFNASVNASYTLDLFGANRRQIEALSAQVDYQQFQLIAADLTLSSNIVTTVITIASLNAQIQTTHALIQEEEKLLQLTQEQFKLGGVSQISVLSQATQVNQTKATLPPLENSLAQNQHTLAVLIGAYPNATLPTIALTQLTLPKHLPVTLPSRLVRQRPDVRASEALLHAASAQVGVATANLFPQLTLNGTYGWEGTVASKLFHPANLVWDVGSSLTQPLFEGGALFAQRREAIDAYQAAFAQYKETVLNAFKQVADVLRALDNDALTLRADRAAELTARDNYRLVKQQYLLGGVSYLNLLTAEQAYQQTVIARIQAEATRYTDTVALFQALGGGWWNKQWCEQECV